MNLLRAQSWGTHQSPQVPCTSQGVLQTWCEACLGQFQNRGGQSKDVHWPPCTDPWTCPRKVKQAEGAWYGGLGRAEQEWIGVGGRQWNGIHVGGLACRDRWGWTSQHRLDPNPWPWPSWISPGSLDLHQQSCLPCVACQPAPTPCWIRGRLAGFPVPMQVRIGLPQC